MNTVTPRFPRIVRQAVATTAFAVALAPLAGGIDTASAAAPSSLSASSSAGMAKQSTVVLKPRKSNWGGSTKAKRSGVTLAFNTAAVEGHTVVRAKLKLKVARKKVNRRGKVVARKVSANWAGASQVKVPAARGKVTRRTAWVSLPLKKLGTATDALDLSIGFSKNSRAQRVLVSSNRAAKLVLVTQVAQTAGETVTQPGNSGGQGSLPYRGDERVFAHYFPPYPVSIDNAAADNDYYARNYLTINGENNKHASYGGLLRDRPLARPGKSGDWKVQDMRDEIRQAKAAGIDGFTLDVMAYTGRVWDISLDLMKAADIEGDFPIIPLLDASSTNAVNSSIADTAAAFHQLLSHRSASVVDGEHMLGSFAAERKSVSWWTALKNELAALGTPVKFTAIFVDARYSNLQAFAPISYAMGDWGTRNAVGVRNARNMAQEARALGTKWMSPIAFQDARPRHGKYAEAGNSETFRAMWDRAISDGADFVQITTWNDYSESTSFAPSMAHGYSILELNEYFAEWFTTGQKPAITDDHVTLSHRIHPHAAQPTSGIVNMVPNLGGSTVAPRDTVEALVFLEAPATVVLKSGANTKTVQLPAGMSSVLVDLATGKPSATVLRGGSPVINLTSPYSVTNSPLVQDMQYWMASAN